jgi:hypothetical protein
MRRNRSKMSIGEPLDNGLRQDYSLNMKTFLAFTVGAAIAGGTAFAASSRTVLDTGQQAQARGSNIVCTAIKLPHRSGMLCAPMSANKPLLNAYEVMITGRRVKVLRNEYLSLPVVAKFNQP